MVGGNPLHDAYGFRYWKSGVSVSSLKTLSSPFFTGDRVEGAPFAEYFKTGDLGRFVGFLACFIQASFTIAGMSKLKMSETLHHLGF
jgi:yeast amino acid transporter